MCLSERPYEAHRGSDGFHRSGRRITISLQEHMEAART